MYAFAFTNLVLPCSSATGEQGFFIDAMTTELSGLSYGMFTYGSTKWATGEFSKVYADAIATIYKRANYNANPIKNSIPGFEDYSYDDVEMIMEAYRVLLNEKAIPALTKNISADAHKKIVEAVRLKSGRSEDLVRVVLNEAYWAAYGKPSAIPEGVLLNPEGIKNEDNSDLLNILSTLKWVAIVGVGAFALSQVVRLKELSK